MNDGAEYTALDSSEERFLSVAIFGKWTCFECEQTSDSMLTCKMLENKWLFKLIKYGYYKRREIC